MSSSLREKVIVITGGGSGIGAGIAEIVAERGGAVAVVDVNAAKACEVAEKLQAAGASAIALPCDVSCEEQVASTMRSVSTLAASTAW